MSKEKRVFSRVRIPSKAVLYVKKKPYPVNLRNISLEGATVCSEKAINVGKGNACVLEVLPEGSESPMVLQALTKYKEENCIGFQFSENCPNTINSLRQLVFANFGNV